MPMVSTPFTSRPHEGLTFVLTFVYIVVYEETIHHSVAWIGVVRAAVPAEEALAEECPHAANAGFFISSLSPAHGPA
jgi:hypothetical protein